MIGIEINVSRVRGPLSPEDELKVATFLHASFSQRVSFPSSPLPSPSPAPSPYPLVSVRGPRADADRTKDPAAPLEFVDFSVDAVFTALRHTLPTGESPDHPMAWLARCPPSPPTGSGDHGNEHEAEASKDGKELVGIVIARSFDPNARTTSAAADTAVSVDEPLHSLSPESNGHVHNKTFNSHIAGSTAPEDVNAKKEWLNTTLREWKQNVLDTAFKQSTQPAMHVTLLGVAPHIQGNGVGRALMTAVHEEADQEGLRVVATCQMERTMKSCLALGYDLLSHDSIACFGDGPVINHWALERKNQATEER